MKELKKEKKLGSESKKNEWTAKHYAYEPFETQKILDWTTEVIFGMLKIVNFCSGKGGRHGICYLCVMPSVQRWKGRDEFSTGNDKEGVLCFASLLLLLDFTILCCLWRVIHYFRFVRTNWSSNVRYSRCSWGPHYKAFFFPGHKFSCPWETFYCSSRFNISYLVAALNVIC